MYTLDTETLTVDVDGHETTFVVKCPSNPLVITDSTVSVEHLTAIGMVSPSCLQFINPACQAAHRSKFTKVLYDVIQAVSSSVLLSPSEAYELLKTSFVAAYGERARQPGLHLGCLTLGEHSSTLKKDGVRFASHRGKGVCRDDQGKAEKGPPIGHNFRCGSCNAVYTELEIFEAFF
ncbi:hypothetical protein MP638_002004, partial [Amoeboaphelidium occidentale]